MGTTASLLTVEEFRRISEEDRTESERGKLELLDGELIRSILPTMFQHTRIIHRTYQALAPFAGTNQLGEIYIEAEYRLGERILLRPDVSIAHPNHPVANDDLNGAPLLAIEVISPANTAEEMDRKVNLYLSHGGLEVWLLYPKTRSAWVYREGHADEFRARLRAALLPDLVIDLEQIFRRALQHARAGMRFLIS